MPRSKVNINQLQNLNAAIKTFNSNTEAEMAAYHRSVMNLMDQFEAKLAELERIREQKLLALDRCEYRRSFDNSISCAAQASAFYAADDRCRRCRALVAQARIIVNEYEAYANSYRRTKDNFCSRAEKGLINVERVISEYTSDTIPATENLLLNEVSVTSQGSSPVYNPTDIESSQGDSFMFVRGGEQIDHVIPKGSGTDPVRINPDAMAESLDRLPEITAPDKSTMRIAASWILAAMAAGGLIIGGRELLLQQKTDEIFESQYGISRTELLLKSGPKQKEYVEAYNGIYRGLQQEMKEVKKEEIDGKLKELKKQIEGFSKGEDLLSVRETGKLEVEIANLENEKASLEDGKVRPHVPYHSTYVAGLTEKEMLYLMDHGNMTPGRFATMLNTLNQSEEFRFTYQDEESYRFKDDKTQVRITQNGSQISIINAVAETDCSANADMTLGMLEQNKGLSWDEKKPKELRKEGSLTIAGGPSLSGGGSCSAEIKYREDKYFISEDGSVFSVGYNVKLGPEVHAEGSFNAQGETTILSDNSNSKKGKTEFGAGVDVSAGVELAKGEARVGMSTRQMKMGEKIVQVGGEASLGGTLGASISGGVGLSADQGAKAKLGASALLKVDAQGHLNLLSLDKLPPNVAKRLSESLPSTKEVAQEMFAHMGEVDIEINKVKPYHIVL